MDNYRIDSHKLNFHLDRLYQWQQGRDIYPIYIEVSLSGSCNNRCIFCAFDYLNYQPRFLDTGVIKKFISEASLQGVRSILYSGEGEPLLHKDAAEIVEFTKKKGIDPALTTNGALLKPEISRRVVKVLSWLRISLNAATPVTYSLVHGAPKENLNIIFNNLKEAVRIKRVNKYPCIIGAQFLLLKENYKEAPALAGIVKSIGLDYVIIKPYSQHPLSVNRLKKTLDYKAFLKLADKLERISSSRFKVIFRKHTMSKILEKKPYAKCLGMPFWAHLTTDGDLYGCAAFIGDKRFCYGNIYKAGFRKIWEGSKRKQIMRMITHQWNIKNCREVCRLDEINRYLWELKHPPLHVNFI